MHYGSPVLHIQIVLVPNPSMNHLKLANIKGTAFLTNVVIHEAISLLDHAYGVTRSGLDNQSPLVTFMRMA